MNNLVISTDSKILYLDKLKNRVFKILPLFEESENEIIHNIYLEALIIDVNSANELFDWVLIDVIVLLNSLHGKELKHKQVKKTILECVNMIDKIKEGYNG